MINLICQINNIDFPHIIGGGVDWDIEDYVLIYYENGYQCTNDEKCDKISYPTQTSDFVKRITNLLEKGYVPLNGPSVNKDNRFFQAMVKKQVL